MDAAHRALRRQILVICVVVPIALLHFVTGSGYAGPFARFVNGYVLELLLPLAFYFLLCTKEYAPLRSWVVKALLVFGAAAAVEVAQGFGIPVLGRTFDLLDFAMYALGVLSAAWLDTRLFPRLFGFWAPQPVESE